MTSSPFSSKTMLEKLPREIITLILKFIDPSFFSHECPHYVYRDQPRLLIPLSQTSRSLRSTVLPLLIRCLSLVRKYEIQRVPVVAGSLRYDTTNAESLIGYLKGLEPYVEQLEVHSSLSLSLLKKFINVESLTIFQGNNDVLSSTDVYHMKLKHLAIALPSFKLTSFNLGELTRLDLLVSTQFTSAGLSAFTNSPLKELNITTHGSTELILWDRFLDFLNGFKDLEKLSLRKRGNDRLITDPQPPKTKSMTDFFNTLSRLPLCLLTIDLIYLRSHSSALIGSSVFDAIPVGDMRNQLSVTFIEPSLGSPWTSTQELEVLQFLNQLSKSSDIQSLKLVYGIQTELLSSTSISMFRDLVVRIHSEEEFIRLRSIQTVNSLMAWNIMDDTLLHSLQESYTIPNRPLSYDVTSKAGQFSPNYKCLLRYDVKVSTSTNGVYLVGIFDHQNHDFEFWSSETISKDLIYYNPLLRRSSLWD